MTLRGPGHGEQGGVPGKLEGAEAIRRSCRSRDDASALKAPPAGRAVATAASTSRIGIARSALLVACTALSIGLCVWGTVGWRRAYRAQAEIDHLVWAEEVRDAQLLRIIVRGGEAAAQLALEGRFDASPSEFLVDGE
jgi:hypothetical protein